MDVFLLSGKCQECAGIQFFLTQSFVGPKICLDSELFGTKHLFENSLQFELLTISFSALISQPPWTDYFTFNSLFPFKSLERYLPLQSNVSIEEPEHEAPPFLGAGLLQRLVLFILSSLASHELHDPQELHAPFTM